MDFKNKKGFITVYVMLAMMFFVAFVVTASVTASRKLKLQKEANTALVEIYSQNIDGIEKNETTIPIYTQAQFIQIANWINTDDDSKTTEYIYINDIVYTLDAYRYRSDTDEDYEFKGKKHKFVLKTDLWFKGTVNDGADKEDYPYIPLNEDSTNVHEALKKFKEIAEKDPLNSFDYKSGHTIYLKVGTETYRYDDVIRVTNAEEFLKIGTEKKIGGYTAYANETYVITEDIKLGSFLEEIYDDSDLAVYEQNEYYRNLWENRPEFKGKITTTSSSNTKIISGLYIDLNVYNGNDKLRSI